MVPSPAPLPDSTRIGAPDSTTRIAPDSSRVIEIDDNPDSSAAAAERALQLARQERRARLSARKGGRFDAPRWVMMRSLLLPGWGQFHNHAWIKGAGVAAGEGALIAKLIQDERDLDRLQRAVDEAFDSGDPDLYNDRVEAYNDRLSASVSRRWLLGAVLVYSLVDAYVDAHFLRGDVALQGGVDGSGAARLAMRWRF